MKKLILLFIFLITQCAFIFAQDDLAAKQLLKNKNYVGALKMYLNLYNKDPKNRDYNYKIGLCYLNCDVDKTKAIPYLEFATRQEQWEANAFLLLGRAYQLANRLDEAIEQYSKYTKKINEDDLEAQRRIETCNNAKELMKTPVNVTFVNLGNNVNTPYADYYPFIPADESFLAFTSRRKAANAVLDYDGFYTSDIYTSTVLNGEFTKAKNAGIVVNTIGDEEVVGMPADGDVLIVYLDDKRAVGDIFHYNFSKNKRELFPAESFGNEVNTKSIENAAAITNDGNKLYFVSDRPGGLGGSDIYLSNKLPNGEWGPAINLGEPINTIYNEDFPHLADDNLTLYFSSQGHNSMGGYDIFKSVLDTNNSKWQTPKNIGYPINTTDDNMTFSPSGSGHDAYVSAIRPEGLGDFDIYKIIFNDVEQRQTAVKAKIITALSPKPFSEASIHIKHNVTDKIVGKYRPRNFGNVLFILPPGKYTVYISLEGFKPFSEELIIPDKVDFKDEIHKTFTLDIEE